MYHYATSAKKYRTALLILSFVFSLSACDVTDVPQDGFDNLDAPPSANTSSHLNVEVENLFPEKIAIEIWSGDNIEYIPSVPEVSADYLKKIAVLEVDALSTQTFEMPQPADVLAIVGVDFNGRYEYLAEEKIANLENGSGLRIDSTGKLVAFDTNVCTANLSPAEVNATTEIVKLVENTANDIATQWDNIQTISNPLDTLLRFTTGMLANDTALLFSELVNWTVVDGVYTHDEKVNNTQLTLTTQFLWGSAFEGRAADETINANLNDPANYFTGLTTNVVNGNITFTYTEAKILAPILGVPVDANPGTYEVDIISWLTTIKNNFNSLQWKMDLVANHATASEGLQTTLRFNGRPSFNITIDFISLQLAVSQNPLTLKLVSASSTAVNTGALRSQEVLLNEWSLKFFPETSGAKGTVEFEVKNDPNFDFSVFMSYNSDVNAEAKLFLRCMQDDAPIRY